MGQLLNLSLGCDLLARLAADERLSAPEPLILLPNFRACERLKRLMMQKPGLMPQLMPLGEVDEVWLLQQAMQAGDVETLLKIPVVADEAHCQLQLAEALSKAKFFEQTYQCDQYLQMAQSIWQVFDRLENEGKAIAELTKLGQADVSDHWQERIVIMRFAGQWWQQYQHAHGVVSSSGRRNQLAQWLAGHWQKTKPQTPVVIAGSTGSHASTVTLMQAALELPQGEVWLQGMEAAQTDLPVSHPQAVFQRLIQRLPEVRVQQVRGDARSDAMLCAFQGFSAAEIPEGISRIDARDDEEEAQLVALLTREALQQGSAKVAIVANNAQRIRRIQSALDAAGIVADSAVGDSVMQLPALRLWQLIVQAAAHPRDAVCWLALMKAADLGDVVSQFEMKQLRGQQRHDTIPSRIRRFMQYVELTEGAIETLDQFLSVMEPFIRTTAHQSPSDYYQLHRAAFDALCAKELQLEALPYVDVLRDSFEALMPVDLISYLHMNEALLAQQKYFSPRASAAAKVQIYSPIEVRLMQADRVILCGLNEGEWPSGQAEMGWLHPLLAARLELTPADALIGLSAHDFLTLSGMGKEVFWLRPQRSEGADQLPSRWLERFAHTPCNVPYLSWLRQMAQQRTPQPVEPPAPNPPLEARPKSFSVSTLEMLLRNPYGFYAKMILKLRALDPIDRPADAALRGQIVHEVMEALTEVLNGGAVIELTTFEKIAYSVISKEEDPLVRLQWGPRIMAMGEAIVAIERERRAMASAVTAEETVQTTIDDVTIEGRIDRHEERGDGHAIIDYKTGTPPTETEMAAGFAPQLPMLAAMVGGECAELSYWQLAGVSEAAKLKPIKTDPAELIQFYLDGLEKLFAYYANEDCRYYAVPQSDVAPRYDDYKHLSREEIWKLTA